MKKCLFVLLLATLTLAQSRADKFSLNSIEERFQNSGKNALSLDKLLAGRTWDCTLFPVEGDPTGQAMNDRYRFKVPSTEVMNDISGAKYRREPNELIWCDPNFNTGFARLCRGEVIRVTATGDLIVEDVETLPSDQIPTHPSLSLENGEAMSYLVCPKYQTH
jgi:hypothetical protein